MSWDATIWPAADYGWITKEHLVDLHDAFNERYKAQNNGSAWPGLKTKGTMGEWVLPELQALRTAIIASFGSGLSWIDPAVTITDEDTTAAVELATPTLVLGEWASPVVMDDFKTVINSMYLENRIVDRTFDGFTDNYHPDISSTSTFAGSQTGAEAQTPLDVAGAIARYTGQRNTGSGTYEAITLTLNIDWEITDIWTGATSELKFYLAARAPSSSGGEVSEFNANGFGLVQDKYTVLDTVSGTAATRSGRIKNESTPTHGVWVTQGEVDAIEDDFYFKGFTSTIWTDYLTVFDWSVSGGFDFT